MPNMTERVVRFWTVDVGTLTLENVIQVYKFTKLLLLG